MVEPPECHVSSGCRFMGTDSFAAVMSTNVCHGEDGLDWQQSYVATRIMI
jgi:hypothetical protein